MFWLRNKKNIFHCTLRFVMKMLNIEKKLAWPNNNKRLYLKRVTHLVTNYSSMRPSYEPVHEIFNNVACATSKASDQPAHKRSLIRAFAIRLSIL